MPETSSPQAARSDVERNRGALLAAAAEELARNPGASMVEIAQSAGLTRATLYRHFGTREKLVEGLRAEALDRASEALARSGLDEGTALEALRRAIDALSSLGVRFRPLLVEGADQDPVFLEQRATVLAPLLEVVRRGQAEGRIREGVPAEWVVTAIAAMLAAAVRTAATLEDNDVTIADLVYGTLVSGIGAADLRP